MAKALLGYVGAVPDRRLVDEVTFLRTRVRALEAEVARLARCSHRLIWLNPLKAHPDYQPLTRGMQAALPHVDLVLVMSVEPGFGGQHFMPEQLEKCRRIKPLLRPDQRLEIDGGINVETTRTCGYHSSITFG